jgi:hypothetical protein
MSELLLKIREKKNAGIKIKRMVLIVPEHRERRWFAGFLELKKKNFVEMGAKPSILVSGELIGLSDAIHYLALISDSNGEDLYENGAENPSDPSEHGVERSTVVPKDEASPVQVERVLGKKRSRDSESLAGNVPKKVNLPRSDHSY